MAEVFPIQIVFDSNFEWYVHRVCPACKGSGLLPKPQDGLGMSPGNCPTCNGKRMHEEKLKTLADLERYVERMKAEATASKASP